MDEAFTHTVDASALPTGYRHIALGDIDSTNTEAFRRAERHDPGHLWLTAERQILGRGRGNRNWVSEPGNLYASLLLQLDLPVQMALQLPFVAGVALHEAISTLSGMTACDSRLALKWPNDLLLDGFKVGGILVESHPSDCGHHLSVAVGFGVNIAHHPPGTRLPATDLTARGITATPEIVFRHLACSLDRSLVNWNDGASFSGICESWQTRAMATGTELTVSLENTRTTGLYAGLDADGALLLNVCGEIRRVLFGDVMFPAPDDKSNERQQAR